MKYKIGNTLFEGEPFLGSLESRPGGSFVVTVSSQANKKVRQRIYFLRFGEGFQIHANGKTWSGSFVQTQRGENNSESDDDSALTLQFPGKVREVKVKVGATVKSGDTLLIVEAMKMEFTIRAPRDGRIKSLRVQAGQQISPGERLVEFESD